MLPKLLIELQRTYTLVKWGASEILGAAPTRQIAHISTVTSIAYAYRTARVSAVKCEAPSDVEEGWEDGWLEGVDIVTQPAQSPDLKHEHFGIISRLRRKEGTVWERVLRYIQSTGS